MFAVSTPPAAKFASRFGIRHTIGMAVPFYLLFILFMQLLKTNSIPLFIIAAVLGISQGFYWMGMHLSFHSASHKNHRGEELGKRRGLGILATLFGPVLGGYLISSVGFTLVFLLAAVFLVASIFVLFISKDKHTPYHFSVRSIINKDHWKDSIFFFSKGSQVIANGVVWPLFIFFILGSYISLGFLGTILSAISALLFWLSGKYSDGRDKRFIVRVVTPFESLMWFLKGLVVTSGQVFAATILGGITNGVRESPMGALEYNKARGEVAAYFVSREMFICLGRIGLLTFVLMTDSLTGGLFLQSFLTFGALLF